jgi:hypothetical protein
MLRGNGDSQADVGISDRLGMRDKALSAETNHQTRQTVNPCSRRGSH